MFLGIKLNIYKLWFWGDYGKEFIYVAARDEGQAQRKFYSEMAGCDLTDIISMDKVVDGDELLW